MKLDEAQLAEQELLRRNLQKDQDQLQKFQEGQEAKLLVQHEREKEALDEKVEASKLELEKQVCKCVHLNVCVCVCVCMCVSSNFTCTDL